MYGDSALGTLDWVEWALFENTAGGTPQKYALVKQGVQRQPMFSFPQSTQQGPIDRPSIDPRLSYVSLLNDLTGGLGYQSVSPTESLTRYFWGSLETRWKGYVTLPQGTTATLTTAGLPSGAPSVTVTGADIPSGASANHHFVYFYDRMGNTSAYYYDQTTGGAAVAMTTPPQWLVGCANVIVQVTQAGRDIYTSSDGTTWTARETVNVWCGLCRFDNKVWSFDSTSRMLYAAVDPTQGLYVAPSTNPNGWRALSDALQVLPGEVVKDLVVWRDNQGQQRIYVVTNIRLVGFDDESGEFAEYSRHGATPDTPVNTVTPHYVVWARDRQLYACFPRTTGEAARWVRQYTGTESEVGPTHAGQLLPAYVTRTMALGANNHHVLLWYTFAFGGSGAQGVLAYNEQGGWHPVFTGPTSGKYIAGGGYDRGNLYVAYSDGTVDVVDLPDSSTPTVLVNSQHQVLSGDITLAETECGAPGVYKLGAYLYVDARKPDNSAGIATNATIIPSAAIDGGSMTPLCTLGSTSLFPAIVPLPGNDPTDQSGLPFRRAQFKVALTKALATDDSYRLVDIGLYYDLWREQRYAYQFAIDFTDAAWGYPQSLVDGRDRGSAIADLLALQDTKRRYRVTFGGSGDRQVVIPAAEILVASRADDNQRGIFPVTIRDVSAPVSG